MEDRVDIIDMIERKIARREWSCDNLVVLEFSSAAGNMIFGDYQTIPLLMRGSFPVVLVMNEDDYIVAKLTAATLNVKRCFKWKVFKFKIKLYQKSNPLEDPIPGLFGDDTSYHRWKNFQTGVRFP